MANPSETTTEDIFKTVYGPTTFIGKSAIPAECGFRSKTNSENRGYPDFFNGNDEEYSIVAEAKAIDHAEAESDIQFYMENNNVRKDLIGIAVSGQTLECLRVTYFYRGANEPVSRRIDSVFDALLNLTDLKKLFKRTKYGEMVSTESLIATLKGLNAKLHKDGKVRATDRSMFFSGLMIALNSPHFRSNYRTQEAPSMEEVSTINAAVLEAHNLNNAIISAIDAQLSNKINNLSKEFSWRDKFSFIKTLDYSLYEYRKIIEDIEQKIFNPFKNDEKQDILGRAYKIFLSRAGNAESKNIILTPDHIKALMVELACLTVDDVVLDTCTGSGGFLMESMETMIRLANGDTNKINLIKEKQLIGFEIDSVLFALACSNMFLHGDGKTNLMYRSSLLDTSQGSVVNSSDTKLLDYIKKMKPTKAIINPPYENNSSIKFALQAVRYLEPNGRLVIIMPTPTLTQNQSGLTVELLKLAKLTCVIKMPDNLFSEQKRGVHTSIFCFTKAPHDKNSNVLFYNLENDGLVSVQHKGKIDQNNKWNSLAASILDCVLNPDTVEGIATRKKIYTANGELQCSGVQPQATSKAGYTLVRVKDLFDVSRGPLASGKAIDSGEFSFITAAEEWKQHNAFTHDAEALVYAVGASGSLGRCHYVSGKFVASNLCLILQKKSSEYPINMEFYKYYFLTSRAKIVSALADGTSKKTINQSAFEDYYIEYVPLEVQNEFMRTNVAKVNMLKAEILKLETSLKEELDFQATQFHCFKGAEPSTAPLP